MRDINSKHFRLEGEAYIHYKSMLISLALHLILLMFELLVCDKLESGRHLWILVFIPLIFISIVSIAVCIWAVKHDRSFEVCKMNDLCLPLVFNCFSSSCFVPLTCCSSFFWHYASMGLFTGRGRLFLSHYG